MKKNLLFGLILLSSSIFAQTNVTNDTIRLSWDKTVNDNLWEVDIKNVTAYPIQFKIKKVIAASDTIAGTETFFCDELCYGKTTYVSPNNLSVAAGATYDKFSSHYSPNNIAGTSVVKYEIYSVSDPTDKVYVVFKNTGAATEGPNPGGTFVVNLNFITAGIKDNSAAASLLSAFPNPTDQSTTISYSLTAMQDSKLTVHNLVGSLVAEKEIKTPEGKITLDTQNWPNGIYYYTINDGDKKIATKKLIVAH